MLNLEIKTNSQIKRLDFPIRIIPIRKFERPETDNPIIIENFLPRYLLSINKIPIKTPRKSLKELKKIFFVEDFFDNKTESSGSMKTIE